MRIGIDLGGTKIEGAAFDPAGGELARLRIATPRDDYEATLGALAGMVRELERIAGGRGSVGIATPGAISPATGLMKNCNSTWLIGRTLLGDLESRLGRPVRIANDADCFALSEATDGAGAGFDSVFGVILGTGVGGGIVVDGRLVRGPNAIAGEWGHNPLPWPRPEELPGPPCYCGRQGCIETFLSGPGLSLDHARAGGDTIAGEEIVARAEGVAAEETMARETMERYEHRLARALAAVVNLLDPHVIVLGGGLSRIERLYRNVPRLWAGYIFSEAIATALRPAHHGDASGVRGAAWLWESP